MTSNWVAEQRASGVIYNVLKALGDDIVFLLPANVCPIVPVTFLKTGVQFEFIDISRDTLCLDLSLAEMRIGKHRKPGLFYVRSLGIQHEVDAAFQRLKRVNPHLFIIDDRCLSRITFSEQELCSQADVTVFSTGMAKYIDLGRGGLGYIRPGRIEYKSLELAFNDASLTQVMSKIRDTMRGQMPFAGADGDWLDTRRLPFSFDEYRKLIEFENKRIACHKASINQIYRSGLDKRLLPGYPFETDSWRFTVFCDNKGFVIEKIFQQNLFASSHYAPLSHLFGGPEAAVAKDVHSRIVNLFNDCRISENKALSLVTIINEASN
jgi:hypothetical protein